MSKSHKIKNFLRKYSAEVILALAFIFAYFPTFLWMWDRWFAKDSYYSHGILVPFVSGYLLWQKRDVLAKIVCKSSRWGIPLMLFGVGLHVISSLFRVYFSSAFSMLFVLAGAVLHLYGWQMLRQVRFPLAFLFFMLPLPLVVIVNISFKMKLFAAEIARSVLDNMGFQVVRDGSIIKMPHAQVIVDDVCSGLRSLISLAALGAIFAHWLKAPMYKRILLFLSTVPIAVVTNVCRVVFLSFVSEVWGPQYAAGFIHDVSGFMVFALAFLMLYVTARVIE